MLNKMKYLFYHIYPMHQECARAIYFRCSKEHLFLINRTAQTIIFMGIAKNYWSESDNFAFALSSRERLLPEEALGEGRNKANLDKQADDCFKGGKHD